MKYIKKVAIVIAIYLIIIFLPQTIYANTLQEALNAQNMNSSQEEYNSFAMVLSKVFYNSTEQKLEEIAQQVQNAKEQAEYARQREEIYNKADLIVNASYSTPTIGAGWCAAWVSTVYKNAGFNYIGGNACDMYWKYCLSNNREDIIPGMIIAVPSYYGDYLGNIYGHVGIIVLINGQYYVRQNVGPITEISLDEWIKQYGNRYEPKWGFAW